jgi:hypothetical protein
LIIFSIFLYATPESNRVRAALIDISYFLFQMDLFLLAGTAEAGRPVGIGRYAVTVSAQALWFVVGAQPE